MLIFNSYLIVFIIVTLISPLSIAKDNLSKIPIPQNPITMAPTVKKPIRTPIIKNPKNFLMFRKNSNNWSNLEFVKVGTIATAPQICKIFNHSFFKSPINNYRLLDTTNGQFRWNGIEASTLWIKKKLKNANAYSRELSLNENTLKIADENFTACLKKIKTKNPKLFNFIKYHFLHYFKDNCLEARFKINKSVDDNGNITEERIPLKKSSCINFDYNSRDYSYWNSTTFVLMLVWNEAHPVLTIFDKGNKVLDARLLKHNQLIEQKRIAEEKMKGESQKQKETLIKRKQDWLVYKSRRKTLMEQVYNFSTTGKLEGSLYNYWVEVKTCELSNDREIINNRKINMTAFRIYSETKRNNKIKTISTDGKFYFSTNKKIPIDRLQNAWELAFKKCPGKTSRF